MDGYHAFSNAYALSASQKRDEWHAERQWWDVLDIALAKKEWRMFLES